MDTTSGVDNSPSASQTPPPATSPVAWQDRQERAAISEYYNESEIDYRVWSIEGYRHFGYWQWGTWPWQRKRMLEAMNEIVFQQLGLADLTSGNVADLGCGTGAVSRYGCEVHPQLGWHAITISQEQADQAREKLADALATHTEDRHGMDSAHHGDYHVLPWPDQYFDAAFFLESLCHSTEPENALREVVRVLKPGGRLVIADGFLNFPLASRPSWFRWLHHEVTYNWAVPAFHEIAQLDRWLQTSGLELVRKREMGWRMAICASHSVPLCVTHLVKMLLRGKSTRWQWKHLRGSALSMLLGMQRSSFGYYVLTLQKPIR